MDFSNRQNRFVRIDEVSAEYLADIKHKTKQTRFIRATTLPRIMV
ncbi:sucrose-6-phosphate hydrolase [Vibrio sp. JCM 19052]|nr:sucrose-6-phosphate hydrolase [Vibrio sp. JCM 19052]